MQFSFKGYFKPTPALFRKIGDSLLSVSSAVTGFAIVEEHKTLAITFLIIGVVGKFMSNFFTDAPTDPLNP